ncbi:unnamed protein product, partial [Phaeothamnion confervicola]
RWRVSVPWSIGILPGELCATRTRRTALCDLVGRLLSAATADDSHPFEFPAFGQYVFERNTVMIEMDQHAANLPLRLVASVSAKHGCSTDASGAMALMRNVFANLDAEDARAHIHSVEDQQATVVAAGGVAFVADGAILPRAGGTDDGPMRQPGAVVPFVSPPSLHKVFRVPHAGAVGGMMLPAGVTLIVGGGFHGKTTLLKALAVGMYDKVPGDGREFAVCDPRAVSVRSEDGRPVAGVDISPFVKELPRAGCTSSTAAATAATAAAVALCADAATRGGGGGGAAGRDGGGSGDDGIRGGGKRKSDRRGGSGSDGGGDG